MPYIVALEENLVFETVAEASRALGVDPSNIRKALQGKRQSAGGYHFAAFETKREITKKATRAALVKYEEHEAQKVVNKVEASRKRSLVNAVHDRLVSINLMRKNAIKEDLWGDDPILQKMFAHTDFYGASKRGGYITSKTHLRGFTADELQNLLDMLNTDQQDYINDEYYNNKSKSRNIYSYAAQIGLKSAKQLTKYWHLLPLMFDLFEAAKLNSEFKYAELETTIYSYMKKGMNEDELADIMAELLQRAKGKSIQSVEEILAKSRTEEQKAAYKTQRFVRGNRK